jgi:hypothetical protein
MLKCPRHLTERELVTRVFVERLQELPAVRQRQEVILGLAA